MLPVITWILFLLSSLSLTNFIENELFLTTSFSLLFSLSGVVVPSEPLPKVLLPSPGLLVLPLPPGTVSTLPSALPDGVWVPPVTKSPVSGVGLVPPLTFPFSVVLVWGDSSWAFPSGVGVFGCCVLSDSLPLVVEFSFG